jgi:hypothetical protein
LRALAALATLSVLAMSLTMCSAGDKDPPPTISGDSSISIRASEYRVLANGTSVDVTIVAKTPDNTNGDGQVLVQVTNGSLNGGSTSTTVTLTNGEAKVKWACDAAITPACRGRQKASATWNGATRDTEVEFYEVDASVDAATDASADAPIESGSNDAGTDVVLIGTLTVTASKPKIFVGSADYALLTASLKLPDGGPLTNEPLEFSTDIGRLGDSPDAGMNTTASVVTNATGTAQIRLMDTNVVGNATVTVTRPATAQSAQTAVAISAAQTISHVATKCGGLACTIIGVRKSGFNEQASVTFRVVDAQSAPVPGVTVAFTIPSPPTGTYVNAAAITDSQGIATATVYAGDIIGSFLVNATVSSPTGELSTPSPTIGIRGAIPTNKGFTFQCTRVNINAFDSPTPPLPVTTTCSVKLVDRFNNAVGTGTAVNFKSEAGTLPNSQATTAYVPGGANSAEGTASVPFSTSGNYPPLDVPPLSALVGQYPNNRSTEPSRSDGLLVRNPRDGLVTLLAYVQGEEWFSDDNNNGNWDSGEQFIDQGEPLLDTNDNGMFDPGEFYLDVNGNQQWDGPNGVRDSNTTVWAETRLLYTDGPFGPTSEIVPNSPFVLAPGETISLSGFFADLNRNYVSREAFTLSLEFTSPRSLTSLITQNLVDDYGFPIDRRLVSRGTGTAMTDPEGACLPSTAVCKYKTIFTAWPGPTSGLGHVTATFSNPSATSPNGGATTCRMKLTGGASTATLEVSGSAGPIPP